MEVAIRNSYKEHCNKNIVPIYLQPWWLDIVAKDNWDLTISKKKENVRGFLPFVRNKKFGMTGISLPLLTQYMGPVLNYPKGQKYSKKLGFEKDVIQDLYNSLPNVSSVKQVWGVEFPNWLPLYWLNYKQTTKYSYVINDIKDFDKSFNNFETKIRGDIRKSEKLVEIIDSDDSSILFNLVEKTFTRKNMSMPYSKLLIDNVVSESIKRNQGKMYYAKDENNNIHAAIFIVWDQEKAYYLLGGGDPEYRNSGATSLLLWNAIKEVSVNVNCFDFEGSMIEAVERFVRGFGAIQIQLNSISKINSKRYFILDKMNEFKNNFF